MDQQQPAAQQPLYAFNCSLGELKALALFQADESRQVLARTLFEVVKLGSGHVEITLVSTNGRAIASYRREVMPSELFHSLPDSDRFTVDVTGCKPLPASKIPDSVAVEVYSTHVDFVSGSLRYTAKRDGVLEESFPNWRGAIPTSQPEHKAFGVDSRYIKAFGKAAKLIADTEIILVQSYGEGRPISVQLKENAGFYGLVMPVHVEEWPEAPDWLREEQKKGKAKTAPAE